ncbi:HTH-type transcriptional activator HxlR [Aquicella siphonis]|uniref:HTH-type transcriptional activator HxlR n=1 Tax=Aquicella siphonis TaxID=254247 RepID=A0A5E4PL58_9COXI|nr:helix-turn-helix domain-containing protein [Aquicella siphonis]VVC77151.1 HTH-type transcriptional activator HxlR [Aquicella siphonis]
MSDNQFDPYIKMCPSRAVIKVVCDKWTILIINLLSTKTCRFGELKRRIEGISQKVLSQTLQKLQRYGFVSRQSYPILPMKVEYELTALGKSLSLQLRTLTEWTLENMPEIMKAERKFIEKN